MLLNLPLVSSQKELRLCPNVTKGPYKSNILSLKYTAKLVSKFSPIYNRNQCQRWVNGWTQ